MALLFQERRDVEVVVIVTVERVTVGEDVANRRRCRAGVGSP
jgi:hypothetical protein